MNFKNNYLLILIFLLLLTRIPFQSSRLYSWDSVQYALALKEYNVSKYQPHPSGYPLYVFVAKILFLFFKDENKSFLYLNLLLSMVAVVFLFKVTIIFFNEFIAFLICLLFISSPLFWSNAEVAVSYCAESAISLAMAYFCLKLIKEKKLNFILPILLGLGAGFRPNLILFLTPLFLFALFISKLFKENFKKLFLFLVVLIFCILIWYLPMIYLSGGYKIYKQTLTSQFEFINQFSVFSKGLPAILINGKNILIAVFFAGFCFTSFIPLIFFINLKPDKSGSYKKISTSFQNISKTNFLFFVFWIMPPILFYVFVFVDLSSYALSYLPGLFVLLGYFFKTENKPKKIILVVVVALIFTANSFAYLKINYPLQEKNIKKWKEKENYITANFNPKNTLILGGFLAGVNQANYFRLAMFYLPQFNSVFIPGIKLNLKSRLKHIGFAKDRNFVWFYPLKSAGIYCFSLPTGFKNIVLLDNYLINTLKKTNNFILKKQSKNNLFFLNFSKPLQQICYKYNYLDFKVGTGF